MITLPPRITRNSRTKLRVLLILFLVTLSFLGLRLLFGPGTTEQGFRNSALRGAGAIAPLPRNGHEHSKTSGEAKEIAKANESLQPPPSQADPSHPSKRIRVKGTVINRKGQRIAQADVFLFPLENPGPPSSFRCTSDASGFFFFQDVPIGGFRLLAQKGAVRSQYVLGSSSGNDVEDITIFLATSGKIIGVVSDQAGAPLPEVEITVLTLSPWESDHVPSPSLQSFPDGTFSIGDLEFGIPIRLSFSKPGFLNGEETVTLPEDRESYPVRIVMEGAGKIDGRVMDEEGNPISGAQVYVRSAEKLQMKFFQTDREGAFKAGDLQERLYDVIVSATDFTSKKLSAVPIGTSELTIELSRGAAVSGKVIFGRINLSQPFTIEPIPSNPDGVETYDSGRVQTFHNPGNEFILRPLRPGEYTLKAESEGWAAAYTGAIHVPEIGPLHGISITMEREITLSGKVYQRDTGEPLSSVLVYLVRAAGPYVPFQSSVSNEGGEFLFRGIPEGTYIVVAGRGGLRYRSAPLRFESEGDYRDFSLPLEEDPHTELPQPVYPPMAGIGVIVERYDNGIRVEKVIPGGPAAQSGMENGDLILEVDHNPTRGLTLSEILGKIRGQEGTAVLLGIDRDGEYFQTDIMRQRLGY